MNCRKNEKPLSIERKPLYRIRNDKNNSFLAGHPDKGWFWTDKERSAIYCVFRFISTTHSGNIATTDSDLIPTTLPDPFRPGF